MQETTTEKRAYSKPSVSIIGSLSEETKTGSWWKKRSGPGDQYIMTDPASCWDGHYYNNCEATSA